MRWWVGFIRLIQGLADSKMREFPQCFTDIERQQISNIKTKGKRKKLWRQLRKRHEYKAREREGRVVDKDARVRVRERRGKDRRGLYLLSGRRKTQGRCSVCGEFHPKSFRRFKRQRRDQDDVTILQTFVTCNYHHHGETVIDERVVG